jgi:prepilin-type processing-associated H-X9-DG protein
MERKLRSLRGFEWHWLWDQVENPGQATLSQGDEVRWLVVSSNGQWLVSSGGDTVIIWNLPQRRLHRQMTGTRPAVAVSPDSQRLATARQDGVHIWDIASGEELAHLPEAHAGWTMAFTADGMHLATADYGAKQIAVWDLKSKTAKTLVDPPQEGALAEGAYHLACSTVDNRVAVAFLDGHVRVWNLDDEGQSLVLPGHGRWARQVSFSPDGKTIASTNSRAVLLWDSQTGERRGELPLYSAESVAFSPDGKSVASGCWQRTIKVWDVASRQEITTLRGHSSEVHALQFDPQGNLVSAGKIDGQVILWGVPHANSNVLARLDAPVVSVAVCSVGRWVVAASEDGRVVIYDTQEDRQAADLRFAKSNRIRVALATGDKFLAVRDGTRIQMVTFPSGTHEREFRTDGTNLHSLAFAPDNSVLAAGDAEGRIWIWASRSGRLLQCQNVGPSPIESLAFSPDGKHLAAAFGFSVVCMDASDLRLKYRCSGYSARFSAVAFSPTENILAGSCYDRTIRLWNAESGKEIKALTGHGNYATSLAFAPDGKTLASGSMELKLWNMWARSEMITIFDETSFWYQLAFSADGQTLVGANDDYSVWIWRAPRETD